MPPGAGPKVPVVLIIAGSGPTDRDGNSPMLKTDCLRKLAEDLSVQGIATLRYDKRGIGKSKAPGQKEEDLTFDTFIDDAASWIERLQRDKRFSRVIVAGHSEGSLLGMVAAAKTHAGGYISIAGAGRPIDVILKEQLMANPNNPPDLIKQAHVILDSLKQGHRVKQVNPMLISLFRPGIQPFMISWMRYDPAKTIRLLTCPVMIVQGTTDIQVSMTDAEALHAASPAATYFIAEGMNHVLRDAPADRAENVKVYFQPEKPLSAGLVPAIAGFVKSGNR